MATKKILEQAQKEPTATTALTRLEKQAAPLLASAQSLVIKTSAQYEHAGSLRRDIKAIKGQIGELLDPIVKANHAAWKTAIASRDNALSPYERADRLLESARIGWSSEQERIRIAEQHRLAQEELAREEEEKVRLAGELASQGRTDEAIAVMEEPTELPVVRIESTVPKQEGTFERKSWSAEVVSLKLLVEAVARGEQPISLIEANMTVLNAQARAFKGLLAIPGVRAVSKTSETVREN